MWANKRIIELEEENARLKERLQVMWEWMTTHGEIIVGRDDVLAELFGQDHPEAADWFNSKTGKTEIR